jgi:glycosyltransferase involved in cell wall biosynthesis
MTHDRSPHRRPRILQLVLELGLGGAESMVALLAQHLDRSRFDVHVWALDEGGDNERRLREAGLPVDVLHKGLGLRWSFLKELRRRFRELRPDLVHAHNTPAARWAALATVGAHPRPLLVRTEHTFNPAKRAEHVVSHAILGARYDAVIGVANAVTERHRRLDPLWRARYLTIPNGIDTGGGRATPEPDRALRAALGFDRDRRLILNLGNLRPPKGQEFLLQAFATIAREFPDVDLAILGEGSLRGPLESLIGTLGLAGRVRLAGHRHDAPLWLAAGDLVVQSSTREGMPVSLLEAARACRPIVATDVGGTREFIENGTTGLLVRSRDAGALAGAMRRVLSDPRLSADLAAGARRRLLARHDIRSIAESTAALYGRLIERR